MGGTAEATVPNPAIADLKSLKARLVGEFATLSNTLKTTNSDMGAKKVWVGSVADTWGKEIDGRRTRIQQLLGKLVPIIDAEIQSLPEKVTPLDAKLYHMDRGR
jgi:hypothetical protein